MSFPKELKNRKQWVCWRMEPDKDGGKPRKMPINPVTGKGAMSNNPNTWSDYQTAFEAYEKYGYTGIGYMFTKDDGFVGVDVDHCYNPESLMRRQRLSLQSSRPMWSFLPPATACICISRA